MKRIAVMMLLLCAGFALVWANGSKESAFPTLKKPRVLKGGSVAAPILHR